jgi:hypothetical protein
MEVPLTLGKVAIIDPEEWALVSPYRWHAARNDKGMWYAHATPPNGKKYAKIKMHNLIRKLPANHVAERDRDRRAAGRLTRRGGVVAAAQPSDRGVAE